MGQTYSSDSACSVNYSIINHIPPTGFCTPATSPIGPPNAYLASTSYAKLTCTAPGAAGNVTINYYSDAACTTLVGTAYGSPSSSCLQIESATTPGTYIGSVSGVSQCPAQLVFSSSAAPYSSSSASSYSSSASLYSSSAVAAFSSSAPPPTNPPPSSCISAPVIPFDSTLSFTSKWGNFTGVNDTVVLYVNQYYSNPSFIDVYTKYHTNPPTTQAVLFQNCNEDQCTFQNSQSYTFQCAQQDACDVVGSIGLLLFSFNQPNLRALYVHNQLVLRAVTGQMKNVNIDVVYKGGPVVTSIRSTATGQSKYNPAISSIFSYKNSTLNVQSSTVYYTGNIVFTSSANGATLLPLLYSYTPTLSNQVSIAQASLFIGCNDPLCATAAQQEYLCVDDESCNAVSVNGYFTLPVLSSVSGVRARNALSLLGSNGWTSVYFIDVVKA